MLSKIERSKRKAIKELVLLFANALKVDKYELLTLWLTDQVLELVQNEPMADDALKFASKRIKQFK